MFEWFSAGKNLIIEPAQQKLTKFQLTLKRSDKVVLEPPKARTLQARPSVCCGNLVDGLQQVSYRPGRQSLPNSAGRQPKAKPNATAKAKRKQGKRCRRLPRGPSEALSVSACVRPLRFSSAFARRELGHHCHDWVMVGVSTGGTKPKTGLVSELWLLLLP